MTRWQVLLMDLHDTCAGTKVPYTFVSFSHKKCLLVRFPPPNKKNLRPEKFPIPPLGEGFSPTPITYPILVFFCITRDKKT